MRVLVTGALGMLGHALMNQLQGRHEIVGVDIQDADLRDAGAVMRLVKTHSPETVIHAAAYTDVDGCETDPPRAWENNAQATLHVAQACKAVGATMVYISTDYVFDGTKTDPYVEEDAPNPLNVYGQTKLRGEQYVQETLTRFFIARTSWLYGPHGKNFVDTIRRLALERNELRVVNDQRGSPTYTVHLASKIRELVETNQYGIYHITGSGACTWFELARYTVELCGPRGVVVTSTSTVESNRPAKRPANSVLENRNLRRFGLEILPHWREGVREHLRGPGN